MKHIVSVGDRFGRLVTLERRPPINGHGRWLCRCDCGTQKEIFNRHLVDPKGTRSCGCLLNDFLKRKNTKHGLCELDMPLLKVWSEMMRRCYSPKCKAYHYYGGRGIAVADAWHDPKQFIADMSPRPLGLTLERTDNNQGYSKQNCKWATYKEQSMNRRNVKQRSAA